MFCIFDYYLFFSKLTMPFEMNGEWMVSCIQNVSSCHLMPSSSFKKKIHNFHFNIMLGKSNYLSNDLVEIIDYKAGTVMRCHLWAHGLTL